MKKIIFILACGLLLSACNDELRNDSPFEVTDGSIQFYANAKSALQSRTSGEDNAHKGNVAFSVDESAMQINLAQNESRGSLLDSIPQMEGFGVYAFETTTSFTEDVSSVLTFNNQHIAVTGTTIENTICTYTPTQFWPEDPSKNLTFMAYSPYIPGGIDAAKGLQVQRTASDKNSLLIRYDVKDDEMQPDLMVADVVTKTNANKEQRVEAKFSHALASVGFTIRANDKKIYSIKLENVVKGGTMKISKEATAPYFAWTIDATKGEVPVKMATDPGQTYLTAHIEKQILNTVDGYLMMLPQDLSEAKIVVEFEDDEHVITSTTFNLSNIPGHKWVAGTKYMYNITLTPFYDIEATPVTFEYGGGTMPYTVISNVVYKDGTQTFASWDAKFVDEDGNDIATPTWLSLDCMSGHTGTVDPVTYNTSAQIGVISHFDDRDITIQNTPEVTNVDLSPAETANCYVVNAAGTYHFRADIMGNGIAAYPWFDYEGAKTEGMSTTINTTGATAELLWQDSPGLIKSVSLSGNEISFTTGDRATLVQGNAVIAIKNASGVIMWSWHIWITDINLTTNAVATNFTNGEITSSCTILDRPLGYVKPKKIYQPRKTFIKFYQTAYFSKSMIVEFNQLGYDETPEIDVIAQYEFGRKDPFIPAKSIPVTTRSLFDINGNVVNLTVMNNPNANNYANSITSPMVYFNGPGWCNQLNQAELLVTTWGYNNTNAKTMYDPCPVGYRMPSKADLRGLKRTYQKSANAAGTEIYTDDTHTATFYLPYPRYIYGRDVSGATRTGQMTYGYNQKSVEFASYNHYALMINAGGLIDASIANGGQCQTHSKGVIPVKINP